MIGIDPPYQPAAREVRNGTDDAVVALILPHHGDLVCQVLQVVAVETGGINRAVHRRRRGETAVWTSNGFDLFEDGCGRETPIASVARDLGHFQAGSHFGGESIEVVKRIRAGKAAIDEDDAVERGERPRVTPSRESHPAAERKNLLFLWKP